MISALVPKRFLVCCLALAAGCVVSIADSTNLADRICASYEQVESLSCNMRRVSKGGGGSARMLSRVFYRRPDHVHVENTSPLSRTIVCDGKNLYYYVKGAEKGFSKPVSDLEGDWLLMLKNVPGTPMLHLMRLRGLHEDILEEKGLPPKRGYSTPENYVVLECDKENRLNRVKFYVSSKMQTLRASYEYDDFYKVSDSCWIPRVHRGTLTMGPDECEETTRVDNLVVNEPIANGLFDPASFFKGVEFTGNYDDTIK